MNDLRIVLLGKTGNRKSSTGNTILGKDVFGTKNSPISVTPSCESKTESIYGRKITVVDAPGFFDTKLPDINSEILQCFTECAPGPHIFLFVLKQERYTEHEIEVVNKITATFGEEALRYAVVLFTHSDQLSENQTIQDFVAESAELQDLVNKCGGRVHVIDNKYWKEQQDDYRSNRVQVEDLLNTIEEMIRENGEQCYTNEMLQMVQRAIEEELKKTGNEGSEKDRTEQAKKKVHTKLLIRLAGVGTGFVVGAFLGCTTALAIVMSIIGQITSAAVMFKQQTAEAVAAGVTKTASQQTAEAVASKVTKTASQQTAEAVASKVTKTASQQTTEAVASEVSSCLIGAGARAGAVTGTGAMISTQVADLKLTKTVASIAAIGLVAVPAVVGGFIGNDAAEGAETMTEAMKLAANATYDSAKHVKEKIQIYLNESKQKK